MLVKDDDVENQNSVNNHKKVSHVLNIQIMILLPKAEIINQMQSAGIDMNGQLDKNIDELRGQLKQLQCARSGLTIVPYHVEAITCTWCSIFGIQSLT